MNKKFYWIGLPICFICLVGITYLIPKTYESSFVVAKESERARDGDRSLSLHKPDQYELGFLRTENAIDAYAYDAIIHSDAFLFDLLDMHVRTLDGCFEGSYADYYAKDKQTQTSKHQIVDDEHIRWKTIQQENIKTHLSKSIKVDMDHETNFVTIRCIAYDPLVAVMMSEAVEEHLRAHIETYQQEKMQQTLAQLSASTTQAKADYEQDPTPEKEAIYKSFARQEVIYKAQMNYSPAFVVLANPSFSYRKAGPSRWKMPFTITLILGLVIYGWKKRREIVAFFHED